jgi:2-amino-4-hydroxy-6-hydroxymethyldihydropteridine diphosphokinase
MHKVFVGIGSNLENRLKNIEDAIENIKLKGLKILKRSPVYETSPYGLKEQPDFLNCVIEIETTESAQETFNILQQIEKKMGRVKALRWGPRIIDLDILFYDNIILNTPELKIPHPDMQNRFFVLKPFSDIAPFLVHPIFKKTIKELLKEFEKPEK